MWDKCEMVVHGVHVVLDLHLDWVVLEVHVCSAFNSISQITIFYRLHFYISTFD